MSLEKLRIEMNHFKKWQHRIIDQLIKSNKELIIMIEENRNSIKRLEDKVKKLK